MITKCILLIFFILFKTTLLAQSFLMNCTSPDFKSTAFYKYKKNENILLIRPMKKKWENFCFKNSKNLKKVTCNFNNYEVIRTSLEPRNDNLFKISYKLDFFNYKLEEHVMEINKNETIRKLKKVEFKCRKIKI